LPVEAFFLRHENKSEKAPHYKTTPNY